MATSVIPANDVQIPPIRTNLTDPVMTNQTAKEWYFFWNQSGDRINTFNRMISYGNHADRLDPKLAPDGALYVESDRSDVLYEKHQDDEGNAWWQYVAGTMWGTLSPDQRPTDLGVHDAGFDYRTNDSDPRYGGRQFIWSGTVWIEVTPNRYGTHADRLALTPANLWQGMIYVETDRSEVIYQVQSNVWHYLAGTMWGSISPDQRPTDLGANDAGFKFRSTDSSALLGGHEWIWSGSIWVETTANRYGTHASRLALSLANTWNGMLWSETDRGGAVYQNQSGVWHYLAGTMFGTASPDQRPTDLGTNDTGFTFYATDQLQEYLWNGTAWAQVAANNTVQTAAATSTLTLTTTAQTIPGTTLSLTKSGTYLVAASIDFTIANNDVNSALVGEVNFASVPQALLYYAAATGSTTIRATVSQHWVYAVTTVPASIYLTAFKTGGTGASTANGTHTTLTALWVSP